MTTMIENEVECSVCGETNSYMGIGSTNSFGSPDLDTRPPEMERSTISYWVQMCPGCGYCAPDLSQRNENVREIVQSIEYQNIIADNNFPAAALPFLAIAHEKQQIQEYSAATWRLIHAAWVCDDVGDYTSSKICREKAISMIEKATSQSQGISSQEGVSEAITIDLMRRAGMFQQALKLAEKTKANEGEEIIAQIIRYEKDLIVLEDIDSHLVSEAVS